MSYSIHPISLKLILIQSVGPTPALAYLNLAYFRDCHLHTMKHIEFSPSVGTLVTKICKDLHDHSGVALLIDYGAIGPHQHSLRVSAIV
jgi:SAM-dependent MidA family methyltransferase